LTTPGRVVGKYGCLPALMPGGLRDLTYYTAGPLPKPPASVAVPEVSAWGMDGNDQYGNCGPVGAIHGFMAAAADTAETEAFPTADQIVSYYLTYTGGQDSGVVLSDFLAYVKTKGFLGHTVSAYAPVKVNDVATLQFTVNAYDFAYTGVSVTSGMEEAFGAGEPWTLDDLDSPVVGGHCIPIVAYDSTWLYCVTWGQVQKIAYPAWQYMAQEAWAVISGELAAKGADGHGINLAALQADLGRLDAPAPAPEKPGLLGELATLVREAEVTAEADFADVFRWLDRHGL
jgi:hypothetical protein